MILVSGVQLRNRAKIFMQELKARRASLAKNLPKTIPTQASADTPARGLKKMRGEHTGITPCSPAPAQATEAPAPTPIKPTPRKAGRYFVYMHYFKILHSS